MSKQRVCFLLSLFALGSCSASSTDLAIKEISRSALPSELNEVSGLWCNDDRVYAINDSGNSATLYTLATNGTVLSEVAISSRNRDWEAITGGPDGIVIGDIGNNRGNFDHFNLHVVNTESSHSPVVPMTHKFEYHDYVPSRPYQHDFDAEALAYQPELGVVMFTKSWNSLISHVYVLDGMKPLKPIAELEGINWLVTGADWHDATRQYVLVGYHPTLVGSLSAHLAVLDEHFDVVASHPLPNGQVEGVCVLSGGDVLVAQEQRWGTPARLTQYQARYFDETASKIKVALKQN